MLDTLPSVHVAGVGYSFTAEMRGKSGRGDHVCAHDEWLRA